MAMPFASLSPAADHHRTSPIFPFCRSSPLYSVGEEAAQHQQQPMSSARWAARPAPFTAAQYEELEQQALIYKYLVAGVPVPPDLLLPIRRGFDSLVSRFYHHHALGYGSYFGKKLDPEPGRCRRTDGKKWRCSKEAAQDSKYCERHMHRGRNRSRKPVETQLVPHSQPPAASAVPPLTTAAVAGGFQTHSLYPAIGGGSNGGGGGGNSMSTTFSSALGSPQLHMGSASPYAAALGGDGTCKDFRYTAYGIRSLADEHSQLITEAINTSLENPWRLPPSSQRTAFPPSSYPPQLGARTDLVQNNNNSAAKAERQQQPLSFPGCGDFDSAKQENQTLRPFFDEWPKARDSWSDLTDENSSLASFSATQLSISIPMTSSDFSVASSQSPNGMLFAGEMY